MIHLPLNGISKLAIENAGSQSIIRNAAAAAVHTHDG
jgi:hypothetical protein